MASAKLIYAKIEEFLDHRLSADDFEDWFLANNWNAHLHATDETVALVHRIEGLLLDWSADALDEGAMRAELANAAREFSRQASQLMRT